jgi:hypothetical protein
MAEPTRMSLLESMQRVFLTIVCETRIFPDAIISKFQILLHQMTRDCDQPATFVCHIARGSCGDRLKNGKERWRINLLDKDTLKPFFYRNYAPPIEYQESMSKLSRNLRALIDLKKNSWLVHSLRLFHSLPVPGIGTNIYLGLICVPCSLALRTAMA